MVDATAAAGYPVQLTVPESNKVANWRPLVHWLMVIPHQIILYVIGAVNAVIAVISWFIIVITGKLPEGMANFMIMYQRYTARTLGFSVWLTEDYPPFSFDTVADDPGDHSIQLSVQAELDGRNRLTVFFRLILLIPLYIVGYVFFLIAIFLTFLAWFAVLFTGRYPEGMRKFVIGTFRYFMRISAYAFLLTDQYPPFSTSD